VLEPPRDHPAAGRNVATTDEARFQALLQAYHYLGALPKIGHTLWYMASWRGQWLALLSFSDPAWKCAARDRWIGCVLSASLHDAGGVTRLS